MNDYDCMSYVDFNSSNFGIVDSGNFIEIHMTEYDVLNHIRIFRSVGDTECFAFWCWIYSESDFDEFRLLIVKAPKFAFLFYKILDRPAM